MYLCKFDRNGRCISIVASGIHFETDNKKAQYIADGYIEVTDDDYEYYVGNKGNGKNGTGYIRAENGRPIDAPVYEPTVDEKLEELDAQYNQDKAALINAYTDSIMSDDTETAESIKTELAALNEKYDADYQAIMSGEGK